MKFKKNRKRFWTLNRHHAEGFTLVELIVVIAILAILGGVAVPAYSGYVEKANKTADIALASEVAHALTLYYYSNPGTAGGYVTITKSGTSASTTEMESAMTAVFGENWQNNDSLALKADWTEASGSSMLNYAINNADTAQIVADSTFLNEASTDGMLDALTTVSGIVSDVISSYSGDVESKLNTFVGPDFVTALNATGVKSTDPEYTTVISNMMVGHFANMLNSTQMGEDDLVDAVYGYAIVYAYAEANNDSAAMEQANAFLGSISSSEDLESLNMDTLYASLDENTYAAVGEYLDKTNYKDMNAIPEIMGALGQISGSYNDKETLSNPNLYNSESVKEQANDYVSAIKTIAGMDADALAAMQAGLGNGNVVVMLTADGAVTVSPALQ